MGGSFDFLLKQSSPRRRGCSTGAAVSYRGRVVVPAQAGVFRSWALMAVRAWSRPRAGGGVAETLSEDQDRRQSSPRRRGCSRLHGWLGGLWEGRPRAGGGVPRCRTRQTTRPPSSPRRRGCSAMCTEGHLRPEVVPAQAGVFRVLFLGYSGCGSRPRAGGGVPCRSPNTSTCTGSSPRRRGCSDGRNGDRPKCEVVPAQAGVFRRRSAPKSSARCRPRAGGGVPGDTRK